YLKSLEIQGFKSFPDKIDIQFPDGITAIVGPNGSGKSNISDAIRWVLGEKSGKQLRSSKMEDVIFTGTAKRRPQGFAQVSLTIDNSDHALPVEFNEVTVSRRYYRSGESEYYINKQQVRWKDITELFLDTGLGKDGYSIIGQGKIAEILSPKSDDRRAVLEEVAGISKYRYSKNEAMRKLQSTEDNLVRLCDILNELAERVPVLESQSKKAKQYLEYRDEKTSLEISVWLYEIERIKENSVKIKEDYSIAAAQLQDVSRELENIENDISTHFSGNQQINVELENLRFSVSEAEEKVAELQSSVAVLESKITYMVQDIQKAENEMLSIDGRCAEIMASIDECRKQAEEKRQQITACQQQMTSFYEQMEELSHSSEGQQQKSVEIRSEIARLSEEKNNLRMERISVETQINALEEHKQEVLLSIGQKEPEAAVVQGEIDEVDAQLTECDAKLTELTNVEEGIRYLSDIKRQAYEKAADEAEAAAQDVTQKHNRLQMLKDMEKHLEGYQGSVKTVLQEAERGRLQGVCGTISQLIRVPKEYITAIETALGGAIQNIVAKTEVDAKKAIFLLKSQNAGRVTVLPLDTIRPTVLEEKEYKKYAGFIGVAADLVKTDYPKAIQFLLGKILVVDHLDHATSMAAGIGHKHRIVTLDGQIVNVGGSLTGGSASKSSGLLSRSLEQERIASELEKAKEIAEEKQRAALKAKEDFALA
ncbi:MAG: chromosome segregation protein SMC, partial [Clostridia bacterium]|nr:chromosome segregation protein SMC [Clostridia bacterium]